MRHQVVSRLLVLLALSGAPGLIFPQAATAPMRNADVIDLVQAGFSEDIIIAKIQAAPSTAFDTGLPGLAALKQASVPSSVVRAMIQPHPPAAAPGPNGLMAPAAASGDPDDPLAPHNPGIYALSTGADGQTHMVKLETEHPRGFKSSGRLASVVTHGIMSSKSQEVLDGAKAPVTLTATRPDFYAYLPQGGDSYSFTGGMSLKDVVLTRLDVQGDTRTSTFGSHGLFASSEKGNDQKARQGYSSEQVKPGIYKLTLGGDLTAGQYAFKLVGTYFDFGIQPQS